MHRSTTRWTTAAAFAALIALPVAGAAQTTGTTPQQPPAQPQPQDPTPTPAPASTTTPDKAPPAARSMRPRPRDTSAKRVTR